ncbi:MAG TPA: phosphatidate cytidylyltransferase [Sphingobium sp.]|uniref:phosphatidate cytidylyltransferase n=1 Tax=Sphingobium sp. TaxID=1912891 RepID=UPI002ED5411F
MTTDTAAPVKKSDLGVRVASGIVMILLAVAALSLGGVVLLAFVLAIMIGVLWEAWGLVRGIAASPGARLLWMVALTIYALGAAAGLLNSPSSLRWLAIVSVIATDTGAYFSGRAIGGPKIAPAISPSKTWAGLGGGMVGAALVMLIFTFTLAYALSGLDGTPPSLGKIHWSIPATLAVIGIGAFVAILAQAGDFFESWMKRRAGVKDSGRLIPGHGGLFDRVDGLLPVAFLLGVLNGGGWL